MELFTAPWHLGFNNPNNHIDDLVHHYYTILDSDIDKNIPSKTLSNRKKDKPWMTNHIRHLIMERNRMNGVYDRTKRPDHKTIRNQLRALTKNEIKAAKIRYNQGLRETIADKATSIKKFWSIMKKLYGNKVKAAIPTLIDNGTYYCTDKEKANLFAEFFASTCTLSEPSEGYALPPLHYKTNERISDVYFDEVDVWNIMSHLNVSKASGPDNISQRFLKECAHSLAAPFCRLFQRSMNDGIFPTAWKISNISPVFKKAVRFLKENYRPVSLLSCISKVMERVVYNTLYQYFKRHGLLSERNSGFKENDCTINQLIHLCNNIYKGLDKSKDVCLVFLDVSKAFDKVYHKGLLLKLEQLGVCGNLLKWLESYLSNRKQRVVINGQMSDSKSINASVPQGSILGPLLFLVYVNDLVDYLQTTPYLFADDTSLLATINPQNPPQTFTEINNDLQTLSEWASQWRVTFNASKTVYMIVSNKSRLPQYPDLYLHGEKLTKVSSHKHLGVTITSNMTWNLHIDAALKKAASRLSNIRKIRLIITRKARETLYKSLVLPLLEYGGVLFDNCTMYLKQRLESFHRQAAIVCTCAFRNTSYNKLLDELGWQTLDERRKLSRFNIFYKMNHSKRTCNAANPCTDCKNGIGVPPYLTALCPATVGNVGYRLRNAGDLRTVLSKKVKLYNSFVPKTTREWNSLPNDIQNAVSNTCFKSNYKKHYFRQANPFYLYEKENANIHHTRLRLGLSHLRSHLFTYNRTLQIFKYCGLFWIITDLLIFF